jgi:hypothetical protein
MDMITNAEKFKISTMKNILKAKWVLMLAVSVTAFFTACDEKETTLEMPRLFRPINFSVELNKTVATFKWAQVDSAKSYTVQVSADSANFATMVLDSTLTQQSLTYEFPGSTKLFVRLKANASIDDKSSLFNLRSFTTPAENLFSGFASEMVAWQTIKVKWMPGANVTHLVLTASDNTTQNINIPAVGVTSGELQVNLLPKSNYKVEIFNKTAVRGQVNVVVEGDVLLAAGASLTAAVESANPGDVIVLTPGEVYSVGTATYRFGKAIKIRGSNATNLPVICMSAGAASSSSIFNFADGSTLDHVSFENIDFTGYLDNNSGGNKIAYIFNNNVLTNVGTLSFTNCKIRNFGNTPMRLQGGKNQVVENLIFRKCTIFDIGFTSTYAVVNSNSADLINNIVFDNSTIYNFKGSLILRTGSSLKSVSITNCNIDQGMKDDGTARFLLDFNNATFNGGGITITNSIFGKTGGAKGANGARYVAGTPFSVTGSYYTSDYVDDPIPAAATSTSIKFNLTAYPGASTGLWTDPVNGNYSLKDQGFAGKGTSGDLRW